MNCIAVIPARAGSKGIPGKNVALINGKSLVELAIETAISIPAITRVVVTSDDLEVQQIATKMGVELVVRPSSLAQDNSSIESAILHALHSLNLKTANSDVLTLIQPTSPLRSRKLLMDSLQQFIASGSTGSMFGVVDVEHHPAKMLRIEGELVVPFTKIEDLSASRQTLGRVVRQSGSMYITNLQEFLKLETLFIPPVHWVQVESPEAIDIDTPEDLDKARTTASKQKSE